MEAQDEVGLESRKSIQLCIGAESAAPALCAAEAFDRMGLSDLEAVRLCGAARSIEPAICAARLEDIGLEDRELVAYCAALAYPLVPAPAAGSPACVQAGLDRTILPDGEVVRLCRGSTSAAPIDCFEAGDDATLLDSREIVTLCAAVVMSAPTPYGVAPYGLGY